MLVVTGCGGCETECNELRGASEQLANKRDTCKSEAHLYTSWHYLLL